MKRYLIAAVALALTASAADAGTRWINHRQAWQSARINAGIATGRLTPSEVARLNNGQNHVQNLKLAAKSDGVVTPYERLRIHGALNWQSARIYHLKHN
jgi:uncharacterized membrane protein YebE (DUF533 family)